MIINSTDIQKIAAGSLILGGGGGGNVQEGLDTAAKALQMGQVEILPASDISNKDGVVLTISGVGSPASENAFYAKFSTLCKHNWNKISSGLYPVRWAVLLLLNRLFPLRF